MIESLNIVQGSLEIAGEFIEGIKINKGIIEKAIKKDIFAADMANEMVEKDGVSFRDAYVRVGQALDEIKDLNLEKKY